MNKKTAPYQAHDGYRLADDEKRIIPAPMRNSSRRAVFIDESGVYKLRMLQKA